MAGPYPIDRIAAFTQQQKLSPEAAAFIQSQYGGAGAPQIVPPVPAAPPPVADPSLVVPPPPKGVGPAGIPMGFAAPKPPAPHPVDAAPVAPPDVAAPPTPIGPPAPPAGLAAPPPKPGGPMPPAMGGGPALPLQAPAVAASDAALYHGKDPYSFGLTPGQQKLQTLQGQRLYGEGQFAEQDAAIDAQTAQDYSGVAQQVSADADARAAAAQKKAADRQAFLAKYNADTEKQINDYANAKIDPGRLWAGSQGTGNAIAATIGSFVAGIAGFMDPSKDYVGQFANRIEAKIQQDIDLQKAEIAKKGAGIEARRGLYGSYLQQFGQEDAAEAMAYETYLRKTKAQIDSYASKATSEKAKVQLGALSAALEDRQKMWAANRQAAGESMIDAYYAAQAKAQAQAAAAAGSEARKRNEMVFKAQLAVAEERAKKIEGTPMVLDSPMRLPSGAMLPAGSAIVLDKSGKINMEGTEAAQNAAQTVTTITGFNAAGDPMYGQAQLVGKDPKAFNEAQQAYTSIKQDIKTIKDLRAKHNGGAIWSPDDEAKANAAASRVQLALKSPAFFQLGVIAGPDKDYLLSQMPDKPLEMKAAGIVGGDPIGTQLNSVESYLDAKYKNAEATYVKGGAQKNSALPLKPADAKGK